MSIKKSLFLYITTQRPRMEVFIGRLTLFWGLWLLNPWIDTFQSGKGYNVMSSITEEYIWGALISFIGLRMLYAQGKNSLKHRRDAMFGALILWLFITCMIVISNPISTGTIIYPLVLYYIFRTYLWLSQQYRFMDLEKIDEFRNGD